MNEPHPALLNALHSIYSSTNPKYLDTICSTIQDYNIKYYQTLMKYCPEWGLETTTKYFLFFLFYSIDLLMYNKKTCKCFHNEHNYIRQNPIDPWCYSWQQIHESQAKGPAGFLESIALIKLLRKNEILPQRQQMISQYIMTTLLPTISAYYLPQMDNHQQFIITPLYIQNAQSVLSVIGILQDAFPQESEYLLHLQAMTNQLLETVRTSGCEPAVYQELEKQAESLHLTYKQAVGYAPPQQWTQQQVLQHQIDLKASSFASQLQQSLVSEKPVESLFPTLDNTQVSPVVTTTTSQQTTVPEFEPSAFPSLNSIPVLNTSEQLESLGISMMKRTGRIFVMICYCRIKS